MTDPTVAKARQLFVTDKLRGHAESGNQPVSARFLSANVIFFLQALLLSSCHPKP